MKDAASAGLKAASDATAQYSRVGNQMTVSYTHLDVYKRQIWIRRVI